MRGGTVIIRQGKYHVYTTHMPPVHASTSMRTEHSTMTRRGSGQLPPSLPKTHPLHLLSRCGHDYKGSVACFLLRRSTLCQAGDICDAPVVFTVWLTVVSQACISALQRHRQARHGVSGYGHNDLWDRI